MEEITCPKCGTKIASDRYMYCYQCGERLFSNEEDILPDGGLTKKSSFKILSIVLFLALFTALGGGAYFIFRKISSPSDKPSVAG